MKKNIKGSVFLVQTVLMLVLFFGCAVTPKSVKNDLVYKHKKRAADYTGKQELWKALQEWEIVLALYPGDREAQKHVAALKEQLINRLLKSAQSDLTMQHFEAARRKFLSILYLDPNNEDSLHYLKPGALDIIIHQVKEGESLPTIAELYYGDKLNFHPIVVYNPWVDVTNVSVGERLVVPVTKRMQEEKEKDKARVAREKEEREQKARAAEEREEREQKARAAEEREDQEQKARAAKEREEWEQKARTAEEKEEQEQKARAAEEEKEQQKKDRRENIERVTSYYDEGFTYFQQENYRSAEAEWKKGLAIDADHEPSKKGLTYIKAKIEEHYQKGLNYFQTQNLSLAIQEWEKVVTYDPHFQNINQYLEKAYKMQERLEEIRKTTP